LPIAAGSDRNWFRLTARNTSEAVPGDSPMVIRPQTKAKLAKKTKRCSKCGRIVRAAKRCKTCHAPQ
jgi:hypothetical protein